MVAERVDVVDVECRGVRELPSDTDRGVHGIGLNKIVRNHRSNLSGTTRRNETVQTPAAEHGVDIRIIPQQRLIGDANDAAAELVHRTQLKPGTVTGDIQAGTAPNDNATIALSVPRCAQARLQVVGVGPAIASDEAIEADHLKGRRASARKTR